MVSKAFREARAARDIQSVAETVVETIRINGFKVGHVPKRLNYKQHDDILYVFNSSVKLFIKAFSKN